MCRYMDHDYRSHYVCLDCRYHKKSDPSGFGFFGPGRKTIKCTSCGGEMVNVGQDFKPPRRGSRGWDKLVEDIRRGKRFFSCGC